VIELIIQNGKVVGVKCATVEEAVEYQRRSDGGQASAHPPAGTQARKRGRPRKNPPAQQVPSRKTEARGSSLAILSGVIQASAAGIGIRKLCEQLGIPNPKSIPPMMAMLRADLRAVNFNFDDVIKREELKVGALRQGVYFAKPNAITALAALAG
jgi:hypothetical protein